MRYLIFMFLAFSVQSIMPATAQRNDKDPCAGGLDFSELVSFFKIKDAAKMADTLKKTCFEKYGQDFYPFTSYQRTYQASVDGYAVTFNEVFQMKDNLLFGYKTRDLDVFYNLSKGLRDNIIFYFDKFNNEDVFVNVLKDKLHVIEMENIFQSGIGYVYGYKYRDITDADMVRLKEEKAKDIFPANAVERGKLEYRYARVNSNSNVTTINLKVGDKVEMKAGGNIGFGTFAGEGGVNGIDGYESYSITKQFKHGSLLFRIGKTDWDAVSTEKTFTVLKPGIVEFIVNDSDPSNNTGSFWIDLKIIRAQ